MPTERRSATDARRHPPALELQLLLAALMGSWAAPAGARPPEASVDVRVGSDMFIRAVGVGAVGISDPAVAGAEWFPSSNELLISGKGVGETDVAVLAGGRISGVHVRVTDGVPHLAADPSMTPEVHAVCPGVKVDGSGPHTSMSGLLQTEACRRALRQLFGSQAWLLKQTDLTFSIEAMQAQLRAFEAVLKGASIPIDVKYQGATLVLTGTVTRQQAGRAAALIYDQAVAGLPVDDTDLLIEEPDGGAEAPAEDAVPALHSQRGADRAPRPASAAPAATPPQARPDSGAR